MDTLYMFVDGDDVMTTEPEWDVSWGLIGGPCDVHGDIDEDRRVDIDEEYLTREEADTAGDAWVNGRNEAHPDEEYGYDVTKREDAPPDYYAIDATEIRRIVLGDLASYL